jgi:hypothetical protein
MAHTDWMFFAKAISAVLIVFYLRVWLHETARAGSWRAGHAALWKNPPKWQLIAFCVLWSLIFIALIVAFSIGKSN